MNVKVKICGITNLDDALAAVEAGADALGFVLYDESPRRIVLRDIGSIVVKLPPFVAKVGVFVNATPQVVAQAVAEAGLDTLQFHGDESPEYCRGFHPLPAIKAFRIQGAASLRRLPEYATAAWLLDSFRQNQWGGTGTVMNWDLVVEAKSMGRPIILAGGLTPGNVAEAVRRVRPYAVDVSSGVEAAPGRKDQEKMRCFVTAARGA